MAAEKGGSPPKIKLDELTAKLVPDPKAPGDNLLVTGFLGDSADPARTRIYWDASMSSYVDVDPTDIVHSEPLPKDQSPLGGSYIWLKRTARGLSEGQGGSPMTGKFFEGPLMSAFGSQFGGGAAPGAAAFGGPANIAVISQHYVCYSAFYNCISIAHPCLTPLCSLTVFGCGGPTVYTPQFVASPNCPPPPPGGPVEGGGPIQAQAAAMAQPAMAQQMFGLPSLVCSYAPGCWYSFGACPTQYGCGPFHTPNCPRLQAEAAVQPQFGMIPSLVCSYAPHCWYSWGACPTQGGCGGHPTVQQMAFGATGWLCPQPHSIASCGHPCTR